METGTSPGPAPPPNLRRDSASERMETWVLRRMTAGRLAFGGIPPRSGWKPDSGALDSSGAAFGGIPPRSGWKLLFAAVWLRFENTFGGIPPRSGWKQGSRIHGFFQNPTFGGIPPRSGWKRMSPETSPPATLYLRRDSASERMETSSVPHEGQGVSPLRRDSASERMETRRGRRLNDNHLPFGGIPPRSGWKPLIVDRVAYDRPDLRRDSASERMETWPGSWCPAHSRPSEGFRLGADGNLRLRRSPTADRVAFGGIPPRSGWKRQIVPAQPTDHHPSEGFRLGADGNSPWSARMAASCPSEGFRLGADGNTIPRVVHRHGPFGGIPPRSGWKPITWSGVRLRLRPFGGIPPRSGWKLSVGSRCQRH